MLVGFFSKLITAPCPTPVECVEDFSNVFTLDCPFALSVIQFFGTKAKLIQKTSDASRDELENGGEKFAFQSGGSCDGCVLCLKF